ncbi:MAG: ferredoxin family protein [archaeon]|nr:ferredoxin family protein [archaeon]
MADYKLSGGLLFKMASKLPESMLSKYMLKYILKKKVDLTDEIYIKDFRNFSLKVNWDICGYIGYQIYEQTNYSNKYGEHLEDADVTLSIDKMDLIKMILKGESFDPGMGRDPDNNFIITHISGREIIETKHGPRRMPINETFLTARLKDPDKHHPMVITKIPFLRSFEKKRDIEVEGEEYGAYIPINLSAGTIKNEVIPLKVFEHFIDKADNIVIHKCGCREHYKCQNHPEELGCMYMGDDTLNMVIPTDRGRVATKEEARERVRKAIDSGLIPLLGRVMGESDSYGVEDTGHFLSSCFCCSCCCINGKIITHGSLSTWEDIYKKMKGLEVKVDESKCDGCGTCLEVCVFKGREVLDGKAHVDPEFCLGCGRCESVCPNGAISVEIEDPSYIDELIAKIESVVDVTAQ